MAWHFWSFHVHVLWKMSVFVGETRSEARSYPVFDTVVQTCTSLDPPKLWLYVRDGVMEVSLFQIGNWACTAAPNWLSQVVESVVHDEFKLTTASAQVLVVAQSITWPEFCQSV